jgi:hypothetical protein
MQANVGVTFTTPTGRSSNIVADLALCSMPSCSDRIADVFLTTSHVTFSQAQLANITAFIQVRRCGNCLLLLAWAWCKLFK